MYEYKKDVLPPGCWAHARRKLEESLKNDRERAEYAREQIGLLYEVEREADWLSKLFMIGDDQSFAAEQSYVLPS